ncbi:MAG: RNA polymerase sigma factor [Actinomycetota bacterium]
MRAANDRLAALYGLHARAAIRLAYLLTGDRDVAQDLAHDAFVRIGGKVLVLRDPDHARAYLFRTVTNLCRGRGRKLQRERRAIRMLQQPSSALSVFPSGNDEIWTALLQLPIRQRAALFLRYYEDVSEQEAADALNCSLSALKSLVNRGLRDLRTRVKEERDE